MNQAAAKCLGFTMNTATGLVEAVFGFKQFIDFMNILVFRDTLSSPGESRDLCKFIITVFRVIHHSRPSPLCNQRKLFLHILID